MHAADVHSLTLLLLLYLLLVLTAALSKAELQQLLQHKSVKSRFACLMDMQLQRKMAKPVAPAPSPVRDPRSTTRTPIAVPGRRTPSQARGIASGGRSAFTPSQNGQQSATLPGAGSGLHADASPIPAAATTSKEFLGECVAP
jgi:hypothetical protein